MFRHTAFVFVIFLALFFSNSAIAEKFVISGTIGLKLAVITCELKPSNSIVVDHFQLIDIQYDAYNTAVAHQKIGNLPIFDVYFPVAKEYDGPISALEMYRLDSNLNLKFETEFNDVLFDAWNVDYSRVNEPRGYSRFLVTSISNNIIEFRLSANGTPGHQTVAYQPNSYPLASTVADDGRMIAITIEKNDTQRIISIQKLHPFGTIKRMQTPYVPMSLALSGPINISSKPKSGESVTNRFLFFREFQDWNDFHSQRIMMQKIDDRTGNFIGVPRAFTTSSDVIEECCVTDKFYHSVVVVLSARVVFYTELDNSCGKNILKAQVFDPQKSKKIGPPQLILGCDQVLGSGYGLLGMDVAQFEP